MVGFMDDVADEQVCSSSCQENALCEVYTYYRANSTLFPSTCYLLSGFKEPIRDLIFGDLKIPFLILFSYT